MWILFKGKVKGGFWSLKLGNSKKIDLNLNKI